MNKDIEERAAIIVADIKKIFGTPPVLSSENGSAYDGILTEVVKAVWPEDFIEKMHVRDTAHAVWIDLRYDRNITITLQQKVRQQLEFQSKRRRDETERKLSQEHEKKSWEDVESSDKFSPDQKRAFRLHGVIEEVVDDIQAMMNRAVEEQAHALAFKQDMVFHKDVDLLKSTNFHRRNISLEMLQGYRSVPKQTRQPQSGEVIDATFEVTEDGAKAIDAPLVPSDKEQT